MRRAAVFLAWLLAVGSLPSLLMFLGAIYDAARFGGWASRPAALVFYSAGLFGWIALGRGLVLMRRVQLKVYPRWVSLGLLCGVLSVVWWHFDSGLRPPIPGEVMLFMFTFMGGPPVLLVLVLLLLAATSRNAYPPSAPSPNAT